MESIKQIKQIINENVYNLSLENYEIQEAKNGVIKISFGGMYKIRFKHEITDVKNAIEKQCKNVIIASTDNKTIFVVPFKVKKSVLYPKKQFNNIRKIIKANSIDILPQAWDLEIKNTDWDGSSFIVSIDIEQNKEVENICKAIADVYNIGYVGDDVDFTKGRLKIKHNYDIPELNNLFHRYKDTSMWK